MPNGVSFDGKHSYTDYGLWIKKGGINKSSPPAKISYVDVPGADGGLDLTEVNTGEVKYGNRTLIFPFTAMVDSNYQEDFRKNIMNTLHGKRIQKIILDDDPNWYWSGRASVVFSNIFPWKLDCTISVDANPYAMKTTETVVDLTTGTISTNLVEITENTSGQSWNSNFMLGTKDFPNGVPTDCEPALEVGWTNPIINDAPFAGNPTIHVYDSDGNSFSFQISKENVLTSVGQRILYSDLTNAGVQLNKVYRVLAQNIGGCTLSVAKQSVKKTVANERKSVLPEFNLSADSAVDIIINGVQYSIGIGTNTYENIVLKGGNNEIYIPALPNTVTAFSMSFREGKL